MIKCASLAKSFRRDILIPALQQLLRWYKEGKLQRPPIISFPIEEVVKGHQTLEPGKTAENRYQLLPTAKKHQDSLLNTSVQDSQSIYLILNLD